MVLFVHGSRDVMRSRHEDNAWKHSKKRKAAKRKRKNCGDPSWVPGRSLHDVMKMWAISSQKISSRQAAPSLRRQVDATSSPGSPERMVTSPDDIPHWREAAYETQRRRAAADAQRERISKYRHPRLEVGVASFLSHFTSDNNYITMYY